ncbi:DUF4097 family beta strand repeat-containing protein [Companilactobacillus sp. DQM5]|uniref:DUF4097 family beta strand repeat-containing protein n=1 Tax=Companilactobacillus sp. DQM5 TaxID=3463359 RepID=UPI0040581F5C
MKKYYIITSILLFIAMIMVVVGAALGGAKNLIVKNGHTEVFENNSKEIKNNLKEFKKININTSDTNVKVSYGKQFSIKRSGNNKEMSTYKQTDDVLNVNGESTKLDTTIGFFNNKYDNLIEITIPNNKKLDEINIKNSDGRVEISDDITSKMTINSKDSNVYLNGSDINNESYIEADDGQIEITNSIIRGGVKSEGINIENSQLKDIKTESDDNFRLTNSSLQNADIFVSDGTIEMYQVNVNGKDNKIFNNDGDIKINQLKNSGLNISNNSDDDSIIVQGKSYKKEFKNDETNTNLLNISSKDGQINVN